MKQSYRIVALFARWSYDHWDELNDGSPQAEAMDKGPDSYEHILSATFDHPPSQEEIAGALHASEAELANQDGKSELQEYGVLNEDTWHIFLGTAAEWFGNDDTNEFPTIHYHATLRSARDAADRSGARFIGADA